MREKPLAAKGTAAKFLILENSLLPQIARPLETAAHGSVRARKIRPVFSAAQAALLPYHEIREAGLNQNASAVIGLRKGYLETGMSFSDSSSKCIKAGFSKQLHKFSRV